MHVNRWATAYFRCLSLNLPPPVKPRLEYPIPKDYYGITPGWLKALHYQLQNNQTISFKLLWDRWMGACLKTQTLTEILCLGGFTNNLAIPWLRFVGLCAAHLTEVIFVFHFDDGCYTIRSTVATRFLFVSQNLTQTMIMICEILTEEPEGGSAMVTLETFVDLYRFLACIDASQPQVLYNIYFTDSVLSLLEKVESKQAEEKISEGSIETIEYAYVVFNCFD